MLRVVVAHDDAAGLLGGYRAVEELVEVRVIDTIPEDAHARSFSASAVRRRHGTRAKRRLGTIVRFPSK